MTEFDPEEAMRLSLMRKWLLASVILICSRLEGAEIPDPPTLDCRGDGRSLVLLDHAVVLSEVVWRNPRTGEVGCGSAIDHLEDTGHFWFFDPNNIELTCKALDGRSLNNSYWVFCGGLTDVEWWMKAIDNANPSNSKVYYKRPGLLESFADTKALELGPNHRPELQEGGRPCGGRFQGVVRPGARVGLSVLTAIDADNDPLIASARMLQGSAVAIVENRWLNPVSSGTQLSIIVAFGNLPPGISHLQVEIALSDQKSLLPTRCILDFVVALSE